MRSPSLPDADKRFDRVLSSLFFHHLTWRYTLLRARRLHRTLSPAGELHVADGGCAGAQWGGMPLLALAGYALAIRFTSSIGSGRASR